MNAPIVEILVEALEEIDEATTGAASAAVISLVGIAVGLLVISIIAGVSITVAITRGITRPLEEVDTQLSAIASGGGDLTQRIGLQSKDELGSVSRSFNAFMDFQQGLIQGIHDAAERLLTHQRNLLHRQRNSTLHRKKYHQLSR